MQRLTLFPAILGIGACFCLSGCTYVGHKPTPDELRQETAKTTRELKQDTKAVIQGIREGLTQENKLDLNGASREQLSALPGISERHAQIIVAGRPYASPKDLVDKRILSQHEYDRIADRITVKK